MTCPSIQDHLSRLPEEGEPTRAYAAAVAKQFISEAKHKFVRHHCSHGSAPYDLPSKFSYEYLIQHFEHALNDFTYFGEHPHLLDFVTDIESYFACFEECIYQSILERSTFASPLKSGSGAKVTTSSIIEDVYYVSKTTLTDEITILPAPQTLADVARMRQAKEMKRFREVLAHWCETLQEGNEKLEQKMRKDVQKANKELSKLDQWRRFELSPINFWLNAIGGHIPMFSNILTAVNACATVYSSRVHARNAWGNARRLNWRNCKRDTIW